MTPYYDDGQVQIWHGDCRDVTPTLQFDAVLTDPPYGKGLNYGDESVDTQAAFVELTAWIVGIGVPTAFTIPSTKLFDVPRPQWVGAWFKPMTFGFWNTPLIPHWEPVLFYHLVGKLGSSDHWTFNPERPNGHPAPKPIQLWRELLSIMPGDTILDPFLGSGTTLQAARDLGKRAIGIEIEERFCDLAARRMEQTVLPTTKRIEQSVLGGMV